MNYKFIDPKIRGVVKELNDMGYVTIFSCAGHRRNGDLEDGYITIAGECDAGKLSVIFADLGVNVTSVRTSPKLDILCETTGQIMTTFRFLGLGGSKDFYKEKLDFNPSISWEDFQMLAFLFHRNLHRAGIHHSSRMARLVMHAFTETLRGREIRSGWNGRSE